MTFKRSLTSTFMIGMLLLGSSGMIAPEAPRQNVAITAPTVGAYSFVSIPAVLAKRFQAASANSDETGWSESLRSHPELQAHLAATSGNVTGKAWEPLDDAGVRREWHWDFDDDGVWDAAYQITVLVYKLKEVEGEVDIDFYVVEAVTNSEIRWNDNGCHKDYYNDRLGYLKQVGPYTDYKWVEIKLVGQDDTSREVELSFYQPQGTISHRVDTFSLGAAFAAQVDNVSVGMNTTFSRSIGHDRLEIIPESNHPEKSVQWRELFDGPDYGWWPYVEAGVIHGKVTFPPHVACHSLQSNLFLGGIVTNASDPGSPPDAPIIKVTWQCRFDQDDNLRLKWQNIAWDVIYYDSVHSFTLDNIPANWFAPLIQEDLLRPPSPLSEGDVGVFTADVIDYDGTTPMLTWTVIVNHILKATGQGETFYYTPSYDTTGMGPNANAVVTLTASDGEKFVERVINIEICNANRCPEIISFSPDGQISLAKISDDERESQIFSVDGYDPDGDDTLSYTWKLNGPGGTSVLGRQKSCTYIPAVDETGQRYVEVTVSDGDTQYDQHQRWDVYLCSNKSPSIDSFSPNGTATTPNVDEGETLTFSVTASDPDDETLSYTWTLDGVEVPAENSSYTYRPGYENAGTHKVKVVVSDGEDHDALEWRKVTVDNVNRAPTIDPDSCEPTDTTPAVDEGRSLVFEVEASDPDGDDTLSYTWKLDGDQASTGSKYYWYKPDYEAAGSHTVEVIVSDGLAQDTRTWDVAVNNVNRAPIVNLIRPDGDESWSGSHDIRWDASDPDGDSVTIDIVYSLDGGQNGRVISRGEANDGIYSWNTANYSDGADYRVKIVASDGDLTGEDKSYNFTVDNSPPAWTQTTGLQAAVAISSTSGVDVMLSWNAAADDLTPKVKYNVYYDVVAPRDFDSWEEKIADVFVQSAKGYDYQYTVTELVPGQTYYFAVRAEDSADLPNEDRNQVTLSVYSTSGTSELRMDDLVGNSQGVVTGPDDLGAYTFNGSVTIMPKDTLMVDPEATLIFADTSGGCSLNVHGTLIAEHVIFTSDNRISGDWFGIILGRGSHGYLDGSTVEYARTGISCYYCDLTVIESEIRCNAENGIYALAPTDPLTINNSAIQYNGAYGIFVFGSSGGEISDNTIQRNGADGLFNGHGSRTRAVTTPLSIESNTIQFNSFNGISCSRCDYSVIIIGNTIVSNAASGISMMHEGPAGGGPLILGNPAISYNTHGIWSEDATSIISNNIITDNILHGIVCIGSLTPDVGTHDEDTHPLEPAGYNEIWGNGSRGNGGYDIYSPSLSTVNAENNWWGQAVPDSSQFYGDVLHSHPLSTPP